jgi:hypothetical protein
MYIGRTHGSAPAKNFHRRVRGGRFVTPMLPGGLSDLCGELEKFTKKALHGRHLDAQLNQYGRNAPIGGRIYLQM